MKNIYIILFIVLNTFGAIAQQAPQFTQYMYNTIAVNPAYAGSREALSIVALHRSQWIGFDGGPITQTLSIHTPLRNEKIGVGLSFVGDRLGYEKYNYIYADFSYTINISEQTKLAFGVKAGFTHYKLDEHLYYDPDVSTDPYFQEKFTKWSPNVGAGIYLHQQKWYVGISSPKLIENDYNKTGENVALEQSHFYGIAGYVFDLSKNGNFKMRPTALVKYTKGATPSYDATLSFLFYEKLWVGGSYRIDDSWGALVDFKIVDQLRIGYAYDYPISKIRPYTDGSHEIMLIYDFKYDKSKYKSPRYF